MAWSWSETGTIEVATFVILEACVMLVMQLRPPPRRELIAGDAARSSADRKRRLRASFVVARGHGVALVVALGVEAGTPHVRVLHRERERPVPARSRCQSRSCLARQSRTRHGQYKRAVVHGHGAGRQRDVEAGLGVATEV